MGRQPQAASDHHDPGCTQAGSQGQGWAERLRAAAWHAWTTPIFGDAPTTNTPPLEGPALGAAAAAAGTAEAAAGAAPNLAASAPCKSLVSSGFAHQGSEAQQAACRTPAMAQLSFAGSSKQTGWARRLGLPGSAVLRSMLTPLPSSYCCLVWPVQAERDPLCVLEDVYRSGSDTPYVTSAPGSPHTVKSAQPSGQLPTGYAAGAQEPAAEQPALWPAPRPGPCEAPCEPAQESSTAGPAGRGAPRDTAGLQLRPPADEPSGAQPVKPPRPASVPASWLLHPAPAPLPMPPTNHKLNPQPAPALKVRCGRSQHSS